MATKLTEVITGTDNDGNYVSDNLYVIDENDCDYYPLMTSSENYVLDFGGEIVQRLYFYV